MTSLHQLKNTHRPKKKVQRVGRGVGSKRGKTCTKGHKGDKARCGYKTRDGYEGGQKPLYRKLPTKGFQNARFKTRKYAINFELINELFEDGEVVNVETLHAKGATAKKLMYGIKILATGELKKKVTIEAEAYSSQAIAKLKEQGIQFSIV